MVKTLIAGPILNPKNFRELDIVPSYHPIQFKGLLTKLKGMTKKFNLGIDFGTKNLILEFNSTKS